MLKVICVGDGNNIHLIRWVNAIAERGWEVEVLSTKTNRTPMGQIHKNIKFYTVHQYLGVAEYERKKLGKISLYLQLRKKLKNTPYDVLHIHFMEKYAFFLADLRNCLISIWGSDIAWYEGRELLLFRFIKRWTLEKATGITVTSNFLREEVKKYSAKAFIEAKIIPFGIDLQKFSPQRAKFSDQETKIIFIKHLYAIYGADVAVDAFIQLAEKYPNLWFSLVGIGPMEQELKEKVDRVKLSKRIVFPGRIMHEDVVRYLDQADIYVMPSLRDSFGVAALEASAMELPVVACRVGGVPEVVQDKVTGLLIEPGQVQALVESIEYLLAYPEVGVQYGQNGRKLVLDLYQWEQNVSEMIEVYKSLL